MLKSIKDVNVNGKVVLCRFDLNVPLNDNKVADDTKIRRSLPTINYLANSAAKIIIMSHLGRPKSFDSKYSLKPVFHSLCELTPIRSAMAEDLVGDQVQIKIRELKNNQFDLLLLENVRFHPMETKNGDELSKTLANYADIFVFDAFGTAHRAHASTVGVTKYLDSYAGLLVEEEFKQITSIFMNKETPKLAIIGGSKISTKIGILNNLLSKVDKIILGGAMVFTFLKLKGLEIGNSLVEDNMIGVVKQFLTEAKNENVELIMPLDYKIGHTLQEPWIENKLPKIVSSGNIPQNGMGLDIGPQSIRRFIQIIKSAKVIFWNGPVGVFEDQLYREGTLTIANSIVNSNINTIIGGGDTAYAINLLKTEVPKHIHLSTGGGATLEMIAGKDLPGLNALLIKK